MLRLSAFLIALSLSLAPVSRADFSPWGWGTAGGVGLTVLGIVAIAAGSTFLAVDKNCLVLPGRPKPTSETTIAFCKVFGLDPTQDGQPLTGKWVVSGVSVLAIGITVTIVGKIFFWPSCCMYMSERFRDGEEISIPLPTLKEAPQGYEVT